MQRVPATVELRYSVLTIPETWVLTEDKVSESVPHDRAAQHLKSLLDAWARRTERPVFIARNLAVRFIEADPRLGIDPDVCVLDPPPPEAAKLGSLRTWQPGHVAPRLCFEVVSPNHPHKDYMHIQDRYAALGTEELVVFDPLLVGPRSLGGPVLLQKWQRRGQLFERVDFGNDPAHSEVLGAWLVPEEGRLRIAEDRAGTQPWLTDAEQERAAKEQERAAKEQERAAKEQERAAKEQERAAKEQERAAKEQERALRQALEKEVAELRAKLGA